MTYSRSPAVIETISNLLMQQPFFAVILMDLCQIQETTMFPVAATNGRTIFINPENFKERNVKERVFILAHEIFHIILKHIPRSKVYADRGFGPDNKKFIPKKANVSQDYIINQLLIESSVGTTPPDALTNNTVKTTQTWDDIYCLLTGQVDNASGFDIHLPPDPNVPELTDAEVQQSLVSAASAAKAQGKMPTALEKIVSDILEPQQDWKEVLKAFVRNTSGRDEASWRRINRRRLALKPHAAFPGYTGTRVGNVAVIIDTSGSISDKELQIFFSEVQAIISETKPERCAIFWTDSKVAGIDELDEDTDITSLKAKGGGGTDMPAAFPVIDEEFPEGVECIICLTDGYTGFNPEPGVPILWAITTDVIAPYGTTLKLTI